MGQWLLFIHLLGAVGMGFYLLLPFIGGKLSGVALAQQAGIVRIFYNANKIAQYLVLVQFLTGGYLMSLNKGLSHTWMAVAVVLLIAIGAIGGIMGVNLKRMLQALEAGNSSNVNAVKVKTFSWVLFVLMIAMLLIMNQPELLA